MQLHATFAFKRPSSLNLWDRWGMARSYTINLSVCPLNNTTVWGTLEADAGAGTSMLDLAS